MKREIQIDGDWLDLTLMLLGIALLTGMVLAVGYGLFTSPFEFKSLGGGSILFGVIWAVLLFVPDKHFRLIGVCFCLGFLMRAAAQFLIRTPEAMRVAGISWTCLRLLGYFGLLIVLIRETRQKVQIVHVDNNA